MPNYTEDSLVEQPAIQLFQELGWVYANCYEEVPGLSSFLRRTSRAEVLLLSRLRPSLRRLNPDLPDEALELAIAELQTDRGLVLPVNANREVYQLLKDGIKVSYQHPDRGEVTDTVRIIEWRAEHWAVNDFFLTSQLWITGDLYTKRPDLVAFVNGIPLILIEFKKPQRPVKDAYDDNLRDYKDTIPHIFWYTAFVILSNGSDTRVGPFSADWEHFAEWKKISDEEEPGIVSLQTAIRGLCQPQRLLDIIENFILFLEAQGGLAKIMAKNHQYLGVNNAFDALVRVKEINQDGHQRLGVFWHTQGSGKSFSMVFFSQKVLRKLSGNWSFVVITDRKDLDDQIYKNFANTGVITEPEEEVRAQDRDHLRRLLSEDHRVVFTLIQKFQTDKGEPYPQLTDRDDVIVMTDEAHRTQYDVLALNMRNALPRAAFIGFTGTPLIAGEEKTRDVFGEYVSIYNFRQSIEDRATVPLYYENRSPELEITNPNLDDDIVRLIENADLDEAQEKEFEREYTTEYQLITREDRLKAIAEDIAEHFLGRGFQGKAMVISIDKATAVKMYDHVSSAWAEKLASLKAKADPSDEELIAYMEETDMAVVVSQGQNEIADLREKGADIRPHRERMLKEDLETKFKDPADPFRLVFVTAMWMTGFDAPSCSTIYLDKPMRNHTLMQTIARANRVWKDKVNGLIVDYMNIFRELEKALAIYGAGYGGQIEEGDLPVAIKDELVELLREALEETDAYLTNLGGDLAGIQGADGFERVAKIDEAVAAVLVNDEAKQRYLNYATQVDKLFHAILPDPRANEFGMIRKAIIVVAERIRSLDPRADISAIMQEINDLLDRSIAPTSYRILAEERAEYVGDRVIDLSEIDFELLRDRFETSIKRIEIEKLRNLIDKKLQELVQRNRTRMDYLEKFQQLIDDYNTGAQNLDLFFGKLIDFAQNLTEEEQRGISENLSEEELAIFDLLTKPEPKLSKQEEEAVKEVARELLDTLKAERLVLDWRKRQQTRSAVEVEIKNILDKLPSIYTTEIYTQKCEVVYQHVFDSYGGEGRSVYAG